METVLKKWGIPILGIGALSAFPVVFMYFNNASEADFSDAVQPLAVFCAIGAAVFLAAYLLTRSPGKSSLIAGTFMLAFCNFSLLEAGLKALFPNLFYWHTLPIVLVIWLEVSILIWAFLSDEAGDLVALVMCLVFCGLILVNAAAGMPKLLEKLQTNRQLAERNEEPVVQTEANGDMPNVYLLIFDEYANFPQMEEYYHYDNAVLKDFLTENHFTISYDSHNESIYTTTVLTNLVNLDYVVSDDDSPGKKELVRKGGALFTQMQEHGYAVRMVDTYRAFGGDSLVEAEKSASAATAAGEDLAYLIYSKTAAYPLCTVDTSSIYSTIVETEAFLSSEELIPASPAFTLAYLNFPHAPFVMDEDGEPIPSNCYYNWAYYLGQHKYATKIMIETIENILENDGDSIIVIQSDHGARSIPTSLELKSNPLNAVYYRSIPIDEIKGLSSVNTLRVILSQLWGEELALLDVPPAKPMVEQGSDYD